MVEPGAKAALMSKMEPASRKRQTSAVQMTQRKTRSVIRWVVLCRAWKNRRTSSMTMPLNCSEMLMTGPPLLIKKQKMWKILSAWENIITLNKEKGKRKTDAGRGGMEDVS